MAHPPPQVLQGSWWAPAQGGMEDGAGDDPGPALLLLSSVQVSLPACPHPKNMAGEKTPLGL